MASPPPLLPLRIHPLPIAVRDPPGTHHRGKGAGLTAAVVIWFVIDGALSAATGFALNTLPNTALAIAYLVPLLASGVLKARA